MNLEEFLIEAKLNTYANSNIKKSESSRVGSSDYHYEKDINGDKFIYHDTYFGGTKFMGEEVVYFNSETPLWGMNYYGITMDENMAEEAMDAALRPALMKIGEDKSVLPLRGPKYYENNGYIYTFEVRGSIDSFDGVEQIRKGENLIYELHCHGGLIK